MSACLLPTAICGAEVHADNQPILSCAGLWGAAYTSRNAGICSWVERVGNITSPVWKRAIHRPYPLCDNELCTEQMAVPIRSVAWCLNAGLNVQAGARRSWRSDCKWEGPRGHRNVCLKRIEEFRHRRNALYTGMIEAWRPAAVRMIVSHARPQ